MFNRKINAKFNSEVFKINSELSKKPKRLFFWTLTIFCLFIVVISWFTLDSKWTEFFQSIPDLFQRFKEMFSWDWNDFLDKGSSNNSFFENSMTSIWETLSMSFAGTIFGILLAIPFAVVASSNIVKNKSWNFISRFILLIFRTIPAFTYALILVGYFGATTFTVMAALTIFTFSIAGKTLYERIEQIDTQIYIASQATGESKLKSFRTAVWPQISHHTLSTTFYSLETNIRYISIIAGVTKIGIGQLIDTSIAYDRWDRVGFLITILLVIILALELFIWLIKNYIIEDKDFLLDKKEQKKFEKKLRKIKNEKFISFYTENILCQEINNELKNSSLSKNEIKLLKSKKLIIKNNFINEYKLNLINDKNEYLQIKSKSSNDLDLYIWNQEYKINIRIDKKYSTMIKMQTEIFKFKLLSSIKEEQTLKHKEFVNNLSVEQVLKNEPKHFIKRIILYLFLLSLLIYSLTLVKWELANKETVKLLNSHILQMIKISWSSFFTSVNSGGNNNAPYSVVYLLYETLSISVVATFIGAIIAYVLGMLSSEKIVNKYVARFFLLITSALRSIPTYIYALIFLVVVGMGPFTGVLALIMGTIGMLTKYNRELFDDINQKIIFQMEATGLGLLGRIRYGIIAQTSTAAFSNVLYRFEINYKEAIMLGAVGAGNMGFLLNTYFTDQYFSEFGALLLGIVIVTLCIEYTSNTLRNKINNNTDLKWLCKFINIINQKMFVSFKANEKLLKIEDKLSFSESSALYTYTNQQILKRAKVIKKEFNLPSKTSWYLALNEKINNSYNLTRKRMNKLELQKDKTYILNKELKKIDQKFHLFKTELTHKRNKWVKEVKQNSLKEIKTIKKKYF
ncbi:phosphonate transport system permease protein [Entomoplasma ellychniae]|uniref:Phosphonate transport system permease protein n=1 Tax=Entomoplasma ellychniae TaxID=2114 RepID=A0A8E2QZ68_9MOLU|nr:ABC transporter permease subunit [Entomoplasma ellychniae]PPE04570.1 phosphonate transport system permease protein [Entomoplasma ellychniae]